MSTPYVQPMYDLTAFNCPHCGAYADQVWYLTIADDKKSAEIGRSGTRIHIDRVEFAVCGHCKQPTIWCDRKIIFPSTGSAPLPNADMPEDVKEDYNEARDIIYKSPRGAAALLRLALQKLCVHLGEKGENINNDIASLVQKGLPPKMQKALDTVRVVGNEAVHPGVLDLKDDLDTANKIFGLINVIVEIMITQPKQIDELYESKVPETKKEAIEKRDK